MDFRRAELFRHAMEVVSDQEASYAADWAADTDALQDQSFYAHVSNMVDPQDGQTVIDIGTGMGYQLLSLAATNPKGIYIGTERTRANVIAAYTRLQQDNLHRYFAVIANSELRPTDDGKAFWWRDMEFIQSAREQIRHQLEVVGKLMILDDNILYPEVLPALLDGKKIDAGILSMPGGSSSRTIEWPLDPGGVGGLTQAELESRVTDVSNATRHAFYHFMSEHVKTKGRIVVAERMIHDPSISIPRAGFMLIGRHMKNLLKYWEPENAAFMKTKLTGTTVALRGTDEEGTHSVDDKERLGYESGVIIYRFDRNDTPFDEPPLPRPVAAI